MNQQNNKKILSELLSRAVRRENLKFDFHKWKIQHQKEIQDFQVQIKQPGIKYPVLTDIRRIIMKNQITKLAAVLAVVLGLGVISVVGVNIGRYYYTYKGQNEEGHHIFYSEGGEGRLDDAFVTLGADEVTDIEQTRRDLEEIELLRQQDKRELLKVEETMVNDTLEMKVHVYKYELSDDRTIDMREGVGGKYAYAHGELPKWQWEEWKQLKKAGPGEDFGQYEETVEGRVFSFKREKYLLSDGTEVIWSVGTPK